MRSVWYHQISSVSPNRLATLFGVQPTSSSLVLETCLVLELRERRTKQWHAWSHLLGGWPKHTDMLRIKRSLHSHFVLLKCIFFALWLVLSYIWTSFSSLYASLLRLFLVLSCGCISAAVSITFQLTLTFKEPGLGDSSYAERLVLWPAVFCCSSSVTSHMLPQLRPLACHVENLREERDIHSILTDCWERNQHEPDNWFVQG